MKNKDHKQGTEIPHPEEPQFSWREYRIEDCLSFVAFWLLGGIVFTQFFSRYVLNNPFGWTEEVARYLLICVGFLGATIGIRKNTHIFVEVFYRYLPSPVTWLMKGIVDLIRIFFFGTLCWLAFKMMPLMQTQKMSAIPVPVSFLYAVIFASLVIMTIRSCLFAWKRLNNREQDNSEYTL